MNFDPNSSKFLELKSLDEAEIYVNRYPDSAKAYIFYVVYVMKESGDVAKARSIFRRALKSINFKKEDERLNIYLALMNLENSFGSSNSLHNIFKEALVYNNEKKVYNHMVDILMAKGDKKELQELEKLMLKKFKNDRDVWIKFASYHFKNAAQKEGREILNRSLQTIPSKEHSDILGKLAHLEYKYGDQERSLSLYEDILMKYPKRRDLKSIYIHILKELGQHERIEILSR